MVVIIKEDIKLNYVTILDCEEQMFYTGINWLAHKEISNDENISDKTYQILMKPG